MGSLCGGGREPPLPPLTTAPSVSVFRYDPVAGASGTMVMAAPPHTLADLKRLHRTGAVMTHRLTAAAKDGYVEERIEVLSISDEGFRTLRTFRAQRYAEAHLAYGDVDALARTHPGLVEACWMRGLCFEKMGNVLAARNQYDAALTAAETMPPQAASLTAYAWAGERLADLSEPIEGSVCRSV